MLLYVTGPDTCDEAAAQALYTTLARAFAPAAQSRAHPRTAAPCEPVVTRFDLFLSAFSPAPEPNASGLRIALPPIPAAPMWGLAMRPALRELVLATFPQAPRFMATMDPVGPLTDKPTPALPALVDLATSLPGKPDPAQKPVDPRLWLVLAPPMPDVLEMMFLPTFLRAEPWARVARAPADADAAWLEREVGALIEGQGLATRGLVANMDDAGHTRAVYKDDKGAERAHVVMIEGACGLEESYAWRVTLAPGQTYARLHSHSGSEELYVVHSGSGLLRVNERLIPIKTGDVFGKPRGYDCATQIVNPGPDPLVLFDFGTMHRTEVDLCRYPEHGEIFARFAGHRWVTANDALRPHTDFNPVYDRRYQRTSKPT
jgi:uncharacterized cupin superfamily protein